MLCERGQSIEEFPSKRKSFKSLRLPSRRRRPRCYGEPAPFEPRWDRREIRRSTALESSVRSAMPGDESALIAVLDTSVAVRWLVRERGSDEVGRLMERPITWWAPHLIITEIVAAMRRKIVASELSVANAVASMHILKAAVVDGFVVLVADDELAPSALTLALTCEHNRARSSVSRACRTRRFPTRNCRHRAIQDRRKAGTVRTLHFFILTRSHRKPRNLRPRYVVYESPGDGRFAARWIFTPRCRRLSARPFVGKRRTLVFGRRTRFERG